MSFPHYHWSLDHQIRGHFLNDTFLYPFSFSSYHYPIVIVGLMPRQLIEHLLQACQLLLKSHQVDLHQP